MSIRTQRHGHRYNPDDGTTRFALWAPNANKVEVLLWHGERVAMTRDAAGWYETTLPCARGTEYRFVINGDLQVPDPASNAQTDDISGWSQVVDHQHYQWRCTEWRGRPWHETIIYEVHVGLMGGFAGVTHHLPLLMELGITAIELMPVHEFPGSRNWGYDGALLFAPDASYGTPDDLKNLIDCAHELGIMVFLDVVYNHFGPEGNYLGQYANHFFRSDIQTPWGAAIDFRQQEVRDFFIENALMWILDYRIDGLRFDAVHAINDKDFLVELAMRLRATSPRHNALHLMLENEDNSATLLTNGFDAQWNDDGHNVLHHLLTGEHEGYYADFAQQPTAKLARLLNEGFIFQGESTLEGKPRGEPSAHLSPTAFILFLQNHDQIGNRAFGERLPRLASKEALQAATVLLLLSPMVPLLFMGEEWGAEQPFLYFTDHNPELAQAVRDGRRSEFAKFSLFSDKNAREQIPDPNAVDTFNHSRLDYSACLQPGHREWLGFYRELIALRTREITPYLPGVKATGTRILADKSVSARWLLNNGRELRIDLNLGEQTVQLDSPWNSQHSLYRYRVDDDSITQNRLPPYSAVASLEVPDDGKQR